MLHYLPHSYYKLEREREGGREGSWERFLLTRQLRCEGLFVPCDSSVPLGSLLPFRVVSPRAACLVRRGEAKSHLGSSSSSASCSCSCSNQPAGFGFFAASELESGPRVPDFVPAFRGNALRPTLLSAISRRRILPRGFSPFSLPLSLGFSRFPGSIPFGRVLVLFVS